jgi:hypothetical protein
MAKRKFLTFYALIHSQQAGMKMVFHIAKDARRFQKNPETTIFNLDIFSENLLCITWVSYTKLQEIMKLQ